MTTRRYQFAHPSLLEYAQEDEDLTDPAYRQRIHQWADEWAADGWPAAATDSAVNTPRYLLDAYPATLAGNSKQPAGPEDQERLAKLVADIGWVDSAVARVGVDAVLVSLHTAAQVTSARTLVDPVLRVLEQDAHHLRHPNAAKQVGYAATALAWRALALGGVDEVAIAASERLRRLPPPQLVPVSTTERISPNLVSTLGGHKGLAVAVTGEGRVVSGGADGAVRLWDPSLPGDPGRELGRHKGPVWAVAVTGEGLVVSGGDDGAVRLWDPSLPGDPGRELGREALVWAVAVTGEGLVVSGGDDGAVRLWDPSLPGDPGRELGRHKGPVWAVAVTGEGLVVSGGDDGAVRLWDPSLPGDPGRELGPRGPVWAVAVTGEGLVVSGGDDGAVRLWDPSLPGDPRELGRHAIGGSSAAVTTEGLVVSGGYDGAVRLWDPRLPDGSGRELGRHDELVRAVAAMADGLLAVVTASGITTFNLVTASS